HNGALDPGEPNTVSDAAGDYSFTGLSAGPYFVREQDQQPWLQTFAGTTNVVFLTRDVSPGLQSSFPQDLTPFNGSMYFIAAINTQGQNGLFRYDGGKVQEITAPAGGHFMNAANLTFFAGALYFAADGGDSFGSQVWQFDGTTATRLTELNPDHGAQPGLTVVNGT